MPAFQNPAAGQKRKSDSHDALDVRKRQAVEDDSGQPRMAAEQCWMVQWRAPQQRKHKTWDGDAVLTVTGSRGTLSDLEGKPLGWGTVSEPLAVGTNLRLGGKELEVDHPIVRGDFLSGSCFGNGSSIASPAPAPASTSKVSKHFTPLRPVPLNPGKSTYYPSTSTARTAGALTRDIIDVADTRLKGNVSTSVTRESYWTANWRKPQQRKHKTWDGDAFVMHKDEKLTLVSEAGKILGTKPCKETICGGYHTYIGSREVELDVEIASSQMPLIAGHVDEPAVDPEYDPSSVQLSQPVSSYALQTSSTVPSTSTTVPSPRNSPLASKKYVPLANFYGKKEKPKNTPLHSPDAEGAIVMKAPTKEHIAKFNKKNLPIIPVVVDPVLGRHLRPHQSEGVRFLYECVMGLRKHEGQGCILADEMGLGKTLQTIALVWTLLKQNPYSGAGPIIGKALIVCPVSLVHNWKAEFHKWLGKDRVGVFVGDKDKTVIKQFLNSRIHQVLVIGYERLRTVIGDLAYCNPPIGLIICDEGHRLKSANNKTSMMFDALKTPRRIILSGTPIQNDLSEFHAMADFCNPDLLDDYSTFRRVYEQPILKSRAPGCTAKEAEIGKARSAQLLTIAKSFVLRRDASLLGNYLPPKFEYVVFVTPTAVQLAIFAKILNVDKLDNLIRGSTAESLALINMLTKISNSPILLKAVIDKAKASSTDLMTQNARTLAVQEAVKLLPPRASIEDVSLSGKLEALSALLQILRERTEEKCIIVSHYTSTLNILEAFCKKERYTYHRLDGQTPQNKRQEYVNDFNKSSQASRFLFLLSSKAGGVGLNLIGASRLCLIDSDWNPRRVHDLQSMARIHRDGQKRPVFIYRFLTAGTIDEKIYQRQVTKLGLSDSLMGTGKAQSKSDSFSHKDLRDIFSIHPHTGCQTHDLLECSCGEVDGGGKENNISSIDEEDSDDDDVSEKGFVVASQLKPEEMNKMDKAYLKKKKAALAALGEWKHINCLKSSARDNIHDDILRKMIYSADDDASDDDGAAPPKSRLDSLLEAVDLENVNSLEQKDKQFAPRDVPGGTISFLFERTSKVKGPVDEEDKT
ncbi:hypothetical protein JAAARDRAFT_156637 [Jaapia argillacea MUCL 33604]|uniref:DNA repair and recombination protein RAD54B n=1 Tax=Jaapia argillacea MUCL 33604 TaxID=933084 RepID=A0A067Q540_9AGAM|nr:hypothetical protein JAAARDRAFT_156637 [Jaapia argillacea MUCL 33604]